MMVDHRLLFPNINHVEAWTAAHLESNLKALDVKLSRFI
jgi:hypothetical protein